MQVLGEKVVVVGTRLAGTIRCTHLVSWTTDSLLYWGRYSGEYLGAQVTINLQIGSAYESNTQKEK